MILLTFPLLGFFSAVQSACIGGTDNFASESSHLGAGANGYGYGYED